MVREKKSDYFTAEFLSLNTVNISFNKEGDDTNIGGGEGNEGEGDQGGNEGEGDQGGNEGEGEGNEGEGNEGEGNEGNEGEGVQGAQDVTFSDIKSQYSDSEYGKHFKDVTFGTFIVNEGATMWFENVTLGGLKVQEVSTIFLENVKFESSAKISWSETTNQIYIQDCYVGDVKVTKENYMSLLNYNGKGTTIAIY